MEPPGADTVLVRYGEITTKSEHVRGWMADRLLGNLSTLLEDRGIEGTVESRYRSRPLIHTTEEAVAAATRAAADTFGVTSASAALRVEPTAEAIAVALARTAEAGYDGGTFAVRARCAGDDHPFSSEELGEIGGDAVWGAVEDDFEPAVDLDDPDWAVSVECRSEDAYVFLDRLGGPGGLPLGSQEPLVALISGGIDSPVAAYEAMRRGSPVVPLYVDLGRYGGIDHRARVIETVATLSEYVPGEELRLRIAPGGDAVETLIDAMDRGRMLAWRRFTFVVAEAVATREDAVGIVTGEAIGQKSSQTASNLAVTSAATSLPVHRPLVSTDKNDISERAREIGTFPDSTIPVGCNQLVPAQPETRGSLGEIEELEPDELADLAAEAARNLEIVEPQQPEQESQ
ncbi:tRNA S(4)U 4-thiouridine synthase [Halalkaliarchaeum desulfuricum]|uniref:Probable tRNA sulfurtransferase n=1 Tax=Halalkaliarchaeum desulfuricum TaxID=2055893 RepID=A0A343TIX6_9EURY|nr:THUMP domain-containing protein [Halalkaliarchaeum desulfuricum]AUX09048.1 tRNA S(4)U 4-thiouridine synthase [Halalkaliarchaeum desulfuricum]